MLLKLAIYVPNRMGSAMHRITAALAVIVVVAAWGLGQPVPLDISRTSLPPLYTGHNIVELANALEHSPYLKDKSEFETTAAYDTRVAQFPSHPIMGKLTANSHFAFVMSGKTISATYDADRGVMTFRVVELAGTSSIKAASTSHPLGSYVASNAFGAKAVIARSVDHDYYLKMTSGYLSMVSVQLPPAEARALKADGRVLLVCHLAPPYINVSTDYHEGTMTERWESKDYTHEVSIVIDEVWLFKYRTGKVFKRETLEKINCSHVVMDYDTDGNRRGSHSAPCDDAESKAEPQVKINWDEDLLKRCKLATTVDGVRPVGCPPQ